mgnify:CR=1 FL=1
MFKNSILLLALYCLGITAFAQTDADKNSGSDSGSKNNLDNKNYWLIVGVGSLSEVDYETVEGILEYPEYGIDLYFSRKRPGRVIERGFSLGWQPIGTTTAEHSYVNTDTIAGTTDTLSGFLRASNQMIHAYYTPRVTLFKQKSAKLYVEGIAGMKGNALTYRLFDGDADDNGELVEQDVLELRMTWNAGLAIGTRMDINENFALDLRYARVYSGALNKIDSYSIEDDVVYTSDWKAPVGYFRIGLNYVY